MNKNLTILLFLLIGFSISAQNGPKYIREAYASFESGKYFEAIDKCQSAFTKLGSKGSLSVILGQYSTFLSQLKPFVLTAYCLFKTCTFTCFVFFA